MRDRRRGRARAHLDLGAQIGVVPAGGVEMRGAVGAIDAHRLEEDLLDPLQPVSGHEVISWWSQVRENSHIR